MSMTMVFNAAFKSSVHCDDDDEYSGEHSSKMYNFSFSPPPLPLQPPISVDAPLTIISTHRAQRITVLALAISASIAFFLLLLIYYILLLRFRAFLRRRRRSSLLVPSDDPPPRTSPDDVHHVWYIRTVGLDGPTIDSIAVFAYKPGDGLVDGTDCTVCLGEFQEGELLRLLPKCSHAFHVPCIDTWLRAHVNCPLCRAPIVPAAREDGNRGGSSPVGGERAVPVGEEDGDRQDGIGSLQDLGPSSSSSSSSSGASIGDLERGSVGSEEDENWVTVDLNDDASLQQQQHLQHVRRSVSMDVSGMRALMGVEPDTNMVDCKGKGVDGVTTAPSTPPQKAPDEFDRCQSTNGRKFFLPRFARGRSASILPL